ncbi:MAG: hypothetical protein INH41_29360 [Myxococcaceae bacterium]|nr:hypothetical protein [Myxococcaceae bacterium]
MRYALMAVLAMGVVGGYGSAVARAAHHARGGCSPGGGWHEGRWGARVHDEEAPQRAAAEKVAVPVPAPQVVVVMPGAAAAPQTIVVPSAGPLPVVASPTQPVVVPPATP